MSLHIDDLINSGIKELTPYEPGKPIEEIERELGITNPVKLASNENPLGPSPKALEAIKSSLFAVHRYPDGNGFRLKESLKTKYNLDINKITLGNGSNDIIEFIARCFLSPGDNAIFSKYAFAVYPIVVQALGAEGVEVPAKQWGHDLERMYDSINKNTKIIFIANPNNPTGTFVHREEIVRFLEKIPENILVLLDQAYFEYSCFESEDIELDLVDRYPNLVISRTFSKAYGLAGLRIGFSVSSRKIADYFNRIRQPFNVNSLSLVAAEAALFDEEHLKRSLEINKKGKEDLYEFFNNLSYEFINSYTNFICFNSKSDSTVMFKRLLEMGVIARSMKIYKMPNHLRLTIGLEEENMFFKDCFSSVILQK